MVTVKDIAKASGVSPSTVSIILNGQSRERKISEKTCKKVWDAVSALGYKPNIAARTLREGAASSSYTIALYWANDFRTTMLSRFLKGLSMAAADAAVPYEIIIYPYDNDTLKDQTALLTGRRFHGAIIANASQKDMEFVRDSYFPVPVVLYNRSLPGYCSVTVDNYRMGVLAAQALLDRKKRVPWILSSQETFPGMEQRLEGFKDSFASVLSPISPENYLGGENTPQDGARMANQVLTSGHPCDSIYCLSDAIAMGCLYTLNREGIKIPEDISVISIGNGEKENAMYATPSLSTVYLPMEDMACQCLKFLLAHLTGQPIPEKNLTLDTPLTQRET